MWNVGGDLKNWLGSSKNYDVEEISSCNNALYMEYLNGRIIIQNKH